MGEEEEKKEEEEGEEEEESGLEVLAWDTVDGIFLSSRPRRLHFLLSTTRSFRINDTDAPFEEIKTVS